MRGVRWILFLVTVISFLFFNISCSSKKDEEKKEAEQLRKAIDEGSKEAAERMKEVFKPFEEKPEHQPTEKEPELRDEEIKVSKGPKLLPSPTEEPPPVYVSIRDKSPLWSPDGQKIAFLRHREIFKEEKVKFPQPPLLRIELYVINPDSTNLKRISAQNESIENFYWSPDGRKIAFVAGPVTSIMRSPLSDQENIYVINRDGTGLRNLTNEKGCYRELRWSPDGTKIAFERYIRGKDWKKEIWILDAGGKFWYKLIGYSDTRFHSSPTWSPDSKQIAYWNNCHIYFTDIEGKHKYSPVREFGSIPNGRIYWSPDGSKIFVGVDGRIWAISTDSRREEYRNLTDDPRDYSKEGEYDISLSSDGRYLAFVRANDIGKADLAGWKIDTKEHPRKVNLTRTEKPQESSPCWSPDGKKIVYVRDNEIWVMNADGSGQTQLTFERTKTIEEAKRKQAQEQAERERILKEQLERK